MKYFTYCNDKGKIALLFDVPSGDRETIQSVLQLQFLPEFLGKPFYVFPAPSSNQHTMVSSGLASAPSFSQAMQEDGEIIFVGRAPQWISLRKLYSLCYAPAKLGTNCRTCPKRGALCLEQLLLKCAWKRGLSFECIPEHPYLETIDPWDKDDLKKMNRYLERMSLDSEWAYVSPHLTTEKNPFATQAQGPLRNTSQHDFTCISQSKIRYSARSKNAAATRAALKRCSKECILFPRCDWSTRPYYGAPSYCQQDEKGPYTLEKIQENVPLPRVSRYIVSLIAFNGGLRTKIFGYEMQLQRLDFDKETVDFLPTYRKSSAGKVSLSIGDALKLCKIPYRKNDKYIKPVFYELACPLMDDTELRLYLLCCKQKHVRGRSAGFFWIRPDVFNVEWLPDTKTIIVRDANYNVYPNSRYHDLLSTFDHSVRGDL